MSMRVFPIAKLLLRLNLTPFVEPSIFHLKIQESIGYNKLEHSFQGHDRHNQKAVDLSTKLDNSIIRPQALIRPLSQSPFVWM